MKEHQIKYPLVSNRLTPSCIIDDISLLLLDKTETNPKYYHCLTQKDNGYYYFIYNIYFAVLRFAGRL